jgi:3,4-dihydroxyphthalate decarboxylase
MLIRCRGSYERGLAWTEAQDVRLVTLDGSQGAAGELDGWRAPSEFPLHAEVLRHRSDVEAVVHAHPAAVVAADLAGLRIRPIIGAFDIPGAKLAADGVPVYPRSALIRSGTLAREMLDAMAAKPVVILRGHGVTATGDSVAQAVLRVLSVDAIARMSLTVVSAGGTLRDISDEDMAELPDLGSSLNLEIAWRHELARLQQSLASPESTES